jgi:hypothetical protein
MKTLADALVLAVNYLQVCNKLDDAARDANTSFALYEIGKVLRQLPDAELDRLAASARQALEEELARGEKAEAEWVALCRTWMEDNVDPPLTNSPVWDGNDRIDPIEQTIANYRQARDRNGELDLVLPHADDHRVFELLLAIVGDAREDPMARTKAMRHFQHARPEKEADRQRLIDALLAATAVKGDPRSTNDQLVRQYAVLGLGLYADRPEVEAVLFPLLLDQQEDGDVRSAAFQTLCRVGDSPARAEQFRRLLDDDYLREQVQVYFSLRQQRGQA